MQSHILINIQWKFKNIECWNGPLFEFYNYVVHLFYIEEEFLMFINSPINVWKILFPVQVAKKWFYLWVYTCINKNLQNLESDCCDSPLSS